MIAQRHTANLLRRWRGAAAKRPAVWLLAMLVLLQPMLAYMAAPQLGSDAYGRQVLVCTLTGQQLITINSLAESDPESTPASEICPALLLLQTAGTSLALAADPLLSARSDGRDHPQSSAQTALTARQIAPYSSRAPPFFS